MKTLLLIVLGCLGLITTGFAETIILSPDMNGNIYLKTPPPYGPGDTFIIKEDVKSLVLYNIKGTADKYVVVTTAPGVTIGGASNHTVGIYLCQYVKICNMHVSGVPNQIGVKTQLCSDMTFENIQIENASVGFSLKNDPKQNAPETYYPVTINNIVIRNCSAKNCNNEGFYIGHTFSQPLYNQIPSPIIGLTIENLYAENTGWDGIQITNAQNCSVRGLKTKNTGIQARSGQASCVTLQDAVTGSFENIYCEDGTGGLTILGNGEFKVKNVTLKHVATSANSNAIFVDNRTDHGLDLPPRKLIMSDVSIIEGNPNGRYPIYILDGTTGNPPAKKSIPGTITNFTFEKSVWRNNINDAANNKFIGGSLR